MDPIEKLALERLARERFTSEWADSQLRKNRYENIHDLYAPPGGDQWPADRIERPNKLHISANIIRAFVDIEARLLSVPPRLTNNPFGQDDDTRQRAELAEKFFLSLLESSGWDTWLFTWNQIGSLYGQKVLKPFWNTVTKKPDVYVIEQPQNLMLGWGDSDYTVLDWAIYHYGLSPLQAKLRYPEATDDMLRPFMSTEDKRTATGGDHSDPLQQVFDNIATSTRNEHRTGYESNQVMVWDYWYKDQDGQVYNCIHLNGKLVQGPTLHKEYPTIPYIATEHDHEPGYPDGHGTAELLIDIQLGLNRALSHMAQYVWDETDPAYQLAGENAPMTVPPGIVPKAGEVVAPGPGARIEVIAKGSVNNFPLEQLIDRYWETAHKVSGIPEVLFGQSPGAQTSARAIATQIEAAANRLDPKRRRTYEGLRQLLLFWGFMVTKKNMRVGDVKVRDVIKGLDRWNILPPEIMPRDEIEHTQNVINKLNSKLVSLETAMDEVGVEAPIEEIKRVMAERSNAHLFPGDAQAIAAVMATLQSIAAQQAQLGGGSQAAANEGLAAQDAALADQQEAQPTGFEDQNQPMPQPGMAPPAGAPVPGGTGELQPIVRQTPGGESQAMSQIMLPRTEVEF